jgi:chromosome segregation ATPase
VEKAQANVSSISERTTKVEGAQSATDRQLKQHAKQLAAFEASVAGNLRDIQQCQSGLEQVRASTEQERKALNGKIDGVRSHTDSEVARLAKELAPLSGLSPRITSCEDGVRAAQGSIGQLSALVEQAQANVSRLLERTTKVEGAQSAADSQLKQHAKEILATDSQLTQHAKQIAAFEASVAGNVREIQQCQSKLNELRASTDQDRKTLNEKMSHTDSEVARLEKELVAWQGLSPRITSCEDGVRAAQSSIGQLSASVEKAHDHLSRTHERTTKVEGAQSAADNYLKQLMKQVKDVAAPSRPVLAMS